MSDTVDCRYHGRGFSAGEMALMRALIAGPPARNRSQLATEFCRQTSWVKPDGGLKTMMAKVTMLKMHRDGVITLPPARPAERRPASLPSVPKPNRRRRQRRSPSTPFVQSTSSGPPAPAAKPAGSGTNLSPATMISATRPWPALRCDMPSTTGTDARSQCSASAPLPGKPLPVTPSSDGHRKPARKTCLS